MREVAFGSFADIARQAGYVWSPFESGQAECDTPEVASARPVFLGWDSFGKKRSSIKSNFCDWCPGEGLNTLALSIAYRVPPLRSVPLSLNEYFRDCPTRYKAERSSASCSYAGTNMGLGICAKQRQFVASEIVNLS
jgi:hypothetical protein